MAQQPDLGDYVEVPERIAEFYAAHPNGSLQSEWELLTVGDQLHVVVTAYAYRDPYDVRPGIGTAWEPIPGRTAFTRGSELMNGETSAWGRAIAALGFRSKRSVASAEEVRAAKEDAKTIGEDRTTAIGAAISAAALPFEELCTVFGAAGADAPKIDRGDSKYKAVRGMTPEQADAFEAALAKVVVGG